MLRMIRPLEKSSASLSMSVSDLWHGMVSHQSHVSELKNWMPMHSKKKKRKNGYAPSFSYRSFAFSFFVDLLKVSKTTIKFLTCSNSVK